jgi:hypothetical protein
VRPILASLEIVAHRRLTGADISRFALRLSASSSDYPRNRILTCTGSLEGSQKRFRTCDGVSPWSLVRPTKSRVSSPATINETRAPRLRMCRPSEYWRAEPMTVQRCLAACVGVQVRLVASETKRAMAEGGS